MPGEIKEKKTLLFRLFRRVSFSLSRLISSLLEIRSLFSSPIGSHNPRTRCSSDNFSLHHSFQILTTSKNFFKILGFHFTFRFGSPYNPIQIQHFLTIITSRNFDSLTSLSNWFTRTGQWLSFTGFHVVGSFDYYRFWSQLFRRWWCQECKLENDGEVERQIGEGYKGDWEEERVKKRIFRQRSSFVHSKTLQFAIKESHRIVTVHVFVIVKCCHQYYSCSFTGSSSEDSSSNIYCLKFIE